MDFKLESSDGLDKLNFRWQSFCLMTIQDFSKLSISYRPEFKIPHLMNCLCLLWLILSQQNRILGLISLHYSFPRSQDLRIHLLGMKIWVLSNLHNEIYLNLQSDKAKDKEKVFIILPFELMKVLKTQFDQRDLFNKNRCMYLLYIWVIDSLQDLIRILIQIIYTTSIKLQSY